MVFIYTRPSPDFLRNFLLNNPPVVETDTGYCCLQHAEHCRAVQPVIIRPLHLLLILIERSEPGHTEI